MEITTAFVRSFIAVIITASTSFTLGTVVAYQYHALILDTQDDEIFKKYYHKLVRRWYTIGISLSITICFFSDLFFFTGSSKQTTSYFLLLIFLVITFWLLWARDFERVLRENITSFHMKREFYWSIVSMSIVSGITGTAMVFQVFTWLGLEVSNIDYTVKNTVILSKEQNDVLIQLVYNKSLFLQSLFETGMLWWVSSVTFFGAIIAGAFLKKEVLIKRDVYPYIKRLYYVILAFIVSVIIYGVVCMIVSFLVSVELNGIIGVFQLTSIVTVSEPFFMGIGYFIGVSSFIIYFIGIIHVKRFLQDAYDQKNKIIITK